MWLPCFGKNWTLLADRHDKKARSQAPAWERTASEAPPRACPFQNPACTAVRQAEPAIQTVPRQSLGTRRWRFARSVKDSFGKKCSVKNCRSTVARQAFTLIEVLLGAVLLSTLAVTGILGFRIHQRQLQFNQHRIEAIVMTERLLATWKNQPSGVPVEENGLLDLEHQWRWQTKLVGTRTIFGEPTLIVRLEIFETLARPSQALVSVDIVKPAPNFIP